MKNEHSPLQARHQFSAEQQRADYFEKAIGSTQDKLRSIMRFVGRQELAKILAYSEIFESTKGITGSIADCGVYFGGGMMTYANLSAALEPYNYQCKIYGFDTFHGDASHSQLDYDYGYVDRKEFTYRAEAYEDLLQAVKIYDQDRPLNHLSKIELIQGDLVETSYQFIKIHPEIIFRIIHLSVNLYEPTKAAIEAFFPRLASGGALVVHGLNYTVGATKATYEVLDKLNVSSSAFKVCDYYPNVTWLIKP